MDSNVILRSVLEREEIAPIEALLLMQQDRTILPEIYQVADEVNRRLNKNRVGYVRSLQINYTNVCKLSCSFCSFARKRNDKDAYTRSIDDIVARVNEADDVTEINLQGGLNPDLPLKYYVDMLTAVRASNANVQISAFSPVEVAFLARKGRTSYTDILTRFRDAGLNVLNGSGADILNDKLRKKLSADKLRTSDWVDVIRTAHGLGIKSTATILFGHVENEIHICEHLEIIRHLQKQTGGFTTLQFMPFVPEHTTLARESRVAEFNVDEAFRLIAVARMFFSHSLQHITAPWILFGAKNALRALSVGANDLGGTHFESDTVRYRRSGRVENSDPNDLVTGIRKLGKIAYARDAFHAEVGAGGGARAKVAVGARG